MNTLPNVPEILGTVPEVARELRCSESNVYKMVDRGEIPHLRLGSLIRFDLGEVRAWLRSKQVRPSGVQS